MYIFLENFLVVEISPVTYFRLYLNIQRRQYNVKKLLVIMSFE